MEIDYILNLLPHYLLGVIVACLGLSKVITMIFKDSKFKKIIPPLLNIGISIFLTMWISNFTKESLVYGIIIGVLPTGVYSTFKNVIQGVTQTNDKQ